MKIHWNTVSTYFSLRKSATSLGFMLFLALFATIIFAKDNSIYHYTILHINGLKLNIALGIDNLSRLMSIFILLIASLIYQYAIAYLKSDSNRHNFLLQFILVVFSALLLSMSQNLVTAFIAWQFIGISLYLLLNYYHDDPIANKSAKKKFVINRVGDCTFLTAIIIALHTQGTTTFSHIQHTPESAVIATLLFISVLTKCAQFPFHIWLLDTMEAPTPVSALMHAGIINSGGILLTRISHLIIKNEPLLIFMMTISLITILLTGHWKQTQPDVKKQLAYSTSGQMGYMIMQCSVGAFPAAILHLITHGFFKASLFLNASNTLNTNTKNDTKTIFNDYLTAGLISIIICLPLFYLTKHINLTLPLIINAFIFITIYIAVTRTVTEETSKTTKLFFFLLITTLLTGYLFLLKLFSTYLNAYEFTQNIISLHSQIAGITIAGLSWLLLNKTKPSIHTLNDKTEEILRTYLLNPTRMIGEKISLLLDKKPYILIALLLATVAFFLSLSINLTNLYGTHDTDQKIIIALLILNIAFLLAANRAHSLKRLVVMLFFYQVIFISYGLMHQSETINKVIIYCVINLAPVLLLLYNISRNQANYPKHYLTTSLLLLIGIPGSASFISEIALLNAMYQLGFLYLFFYLIGIMLLSLTIMHALQLYSFGTEDKLRITKIKIHSALFFMVTIIINIIFGIFPHLLLSVL